MEGQAAKRRRVYSLEPNKVVQATFTRNYMNYLVPALMKINERTSSKEHNTSSDFQNVIKNEVDMAMVFSAQGFAWSNALKVKLIQRGEVNENNGTSSAENEVDFSSKPTTSKSHAKMFISESKHNGIPQVKKSLDGENDDDEFINGQLWSLRRLIPGGEEMCNEQMVTELESYISCLQMQVNILQCLTETS